MGDRCHAHWRTGVAGISLECGIDLFTTSCQSLTLWKGRKVAVGAAANCPRGAGPKNWVERTARRRMVLMASSSIFPYPMFAIGEWRIRREAEGIEKGEEDGGV